MLCNSASYFPNKVDNMIFFQDNNIEKTAIIDTYNNLIAEGKYSLANDYINQQDGIYGYFADFFNVIENRIYNLQEYLLQKPQKKQPFIYYDEEERFSMDSIYIFSDHDEVENLDTISLFSDNDDTESIDNLLLFTDEEQEPPDAETGNIWI